jgi:hypothetical protein
MPTFNIDLKKYLEEAKAALLLLAVSDSAEIKSIIEEYVSNLEGRMSSLIAYVSENINDPELLSYVLDKLKTEKPILENEVLSLVQLTEKDGQQAFNNLQAIILNAVDEALHSQT